MSERGLVIAIDGPAGAGKSTLASRLARKLGYVNIESGAMYRALGLKAILSDVSFEDEAALMQLALRSNIVLEPRLDGNRVMLDGIDVSERVREADVTDAASRVSVHPRVREWMVARQREMGERGGVVMEGRDIGTAVFPNADLKIFLDASPEARSDRRFRQSPSMSTLSPDAIAREMRARDARDRARDTSPLVPAGDAIVIDSTEMNLEQVMARVDELVDQRLQK